MPVQFSEFTLKIGDFTFSCFSLILKKTAKVSQSSVS